MINLVVALRAEAEPLVARFGLERDEAARGRPVFEGDDVRLVVSGVGAAKARAAVRQLAGAAHGRKAAGWLNLGLAGHRDHEIGAAFLVHRVASAASGETWYPVIPFSPPLPTASLETVAEPETAYPGTALYDMEGAGFVSAALGCATGELVQLLKIVSDNRSRSVEGVTASAASRLVAARLEEIAAVMTALGRLVGSLRERAIAPTLDEWLVSWHFTVTERRRLERLLARIGALDSQGLPSVDDLSAERSASGVLAALAEFLADHAVDYRRGM